MKLKKGLMSALAASVTVTLCGGMIAAQAESNTEAAEDLFFVNGGYIELSGNAKLAEEGDTVVLTVVSTGNSNSSFMSEGEKVVYIAEDETDKKGNWAFEFALDKSGMYKAYIGSDAFNANEVVDFSFIDEDKFDAAAQALLTATDVSAIAGIIEASAADLGIFISKPSNYEGVAELVKNEIDGKTELNPGDDSNLLEKCCLITYLNDKKLTSLKPYKEVLSESNDAYKKYLTDTVLDDICGSLSGRAFGSVAMFEAALQDSVIVSAINNGSTDTINGVLTDYREELGVSSITDSLVSNLTKQDFEDIDELIKYIANPKNSGSSSSSSSSSSSGNSGSSGSSGSSFGSKNTYSGTQVEAENTSNSADEQIYVFSDIADVPWAVEAITQLTYRGVLNGKGDMLFAPNDNITREEFAKVICEGFKFNLVDEDCPFEDVSEDDWSYRYVRSAYIAGIVNGISDTEFGYGQNITREDLCVMIERTLKAGSLTVSENSEANISFADDDSISDYAKESVYNLAAAGIVSGDGENFNPKAYATRAEAAKIVYLSLVKAKLY